MTTQSQQVIVHVHTNVKNKNKDIKDCLKKDGKKKKGKRITVPPLGGDPKPFAKNPKYSRGKDVPYSSAQSIPSQHSGAFYTNLPTVLTQFPQIRGEHTLYGNYGNYGNYLEPPASRVRIEEIIDPKLENIHKHMFLGHDALLGLDQRVKNLEAPPRLLRSESTRLAQPREERLETMSQDLSGFDTDSDSNGLFERVAQVKPSHPAQERAWSEPSTINAHPHELPKGFLFREESEGTPKTTPAPSVNKHYPTPPPPPRVQTEIEEVHEEETPAPLRAEGLPTPQAPLRQEREAHDVPQVDAMAQLRRTQAEYRRMYLAQSAGIGRARDKGDVEGFERLLNEREKLKKEQAEIRKAERAEKKKATKKK